MRRLFFRENELWRPAGGDFLRSSAHVLTYAPLRCSEITTRRLTIIRFRQWGAIFCLWGGDRNALWRVDYGLWAGRRVAEATQARPKACKRPPERVSRVGGFCCPVPPEPRLAVFRQRRRMQRCYRSHLRYSPMTAVQCRAKDGSLPHMSSLFRPPISLAGPIQTTRCALRHRGGSGGSHNKAPPPQTRLVEAPGTAPGSIMFIPRTVYHHSRQAGTTYIGATREI